MIKTHLCGQKRSEDHRGIFYCLEVAFSDTQKMNELPFFSFLFFKHNLINFIQSHYHTIGLGQINVDLNLNDLN